MSRIALTERFRSGATRQPPDPPILPEHLPHANPLCNTSRATLSVPPLPIRPTSGSLAINKLTASYIAAELPPPDPISTLPQAIRPNLDGLPICLRQRCMPHIKSPTYVRQLFLSSPKTATMRPAARTKSYPHSNIIAVHLPPSRWPPVRLRQFVPTPVEEAKTRTSHFPRQIGDRLASGTKNIDTPFLPEYDVFHGCAHSPILSRSSCHSSGSLVHLFADERGPVGSRFRIILRPTSR